jgi:hypothetical protein
MKKIIRLFTIGIISLWISMLMPKVNAEILGITMQAADFTGESILLDPEQTSGSGNFGGNIFVSNTNIETNGTDALGIRIKNLTNQPFFINTLYIQNQGNWSYSLWYSNIRYVSVDGSEISSTGTFRNTTIPANFDGLMVIEWNQVVIIRTPSGGWDWSRKSDEFKLSKTGATPDLQYPTTNLSFLSFYFSYNQVNANVNELLIGDIYGLNFTTNEHAKYVNPLKIEGNTMAAKGVTVSNYPTTKATYNLQINGVAGFSSEAINLNVTENPQVQYGYRPTINPTLTYGYTLSYVELDGVAMPLENVVNMDKSASTHILNFVTAEMYSYKTVDPETTVDLSDKAGVIVDVNNTLGEDIIYSLILTDEAKTTEYTATSKGVGIFLPTGGYSHYGNVFTIPSGFTGQIFIPFNEWRGSAYGGVNNLPFDYTTKPATVSSTIYLSYVLTATINKESLATVFSNWSFSTVTPACSNAPAEAMASDIYEDGVGVQLDTTLVGNFNPAPAVRIPLDKVIPLENSLGIGFRFKNTSAREIKIRIYLTGTNNATYVPKTSQTYFRINDKTGIVETLGGSRDVALPAGFDGTIIVNLKDYVSDTLTIIGDGNSNIDFTGLNLKQVNFFLNAYKDDMFYIDTSIAYFGLTGTKAVVENAFLYSKAFIQSVKNGGVTITPILSQPTYFDVQFSADGTLNDASKVIISKNRVSYSDEVVVSPKYGHGIHSITANGTALERNNDDTFSFVVAHGTTAINLEITTGATVKLTTLLDGVEQSAVTTNVTLGGTHISNPEVDGGTFMFWTVNGAVRTDLPQNLSIQIKSKMELVAHFASTGKYSVAFLDANTKLLDVRYISDNTVTLDELPTPARTGADFKGWVLMNNYGADGILAPETPASKTYFIAKYEVPLDAPTYLVKVNNVEKGSYPINTVVTATTTDPDFVYWKDEATGAILSYQSSFSFTVLNKPISIVSVHEGTESGPMVSIRKFYDYKAGYDTFIGHYELNEDYELIEIGFEHDDHGRHISRNINPETNEFMLSVPNSIISNNEQKMRAYMIYRIIATDEIVTVYSKSSTT